MLDVLSCFEILVKGAYIGVTLHLFTVMMYKSRSGNNSLWKRILCFWTAVSMLLVGLNQLFGVLLDFGVLPAGGMVERMGRNINLVAMPSIGIVSLMLTRHTILTKQVVMGCTLPSVAFFLLYGVTGIEFINTLFAIYSAVLVIGFGVVSFVYYWRYNKALRECYSNIEEYDISWLGVLVLLLVLAAAMRIFMVCFKFEGVQIAAVGFNMIVWSIMGHRVAFVGDAKEMGSVLSIFESGISINDFSRKRHIVAQNVDAESYGDTMGLNIKHVCVEKNLLGDFNFNSEILSNSLGCSKGELSDYFTEHNTTFFNFINNLRLEYAADLLTKTSDSALDIGLKAGFRFDNNFRRMFEDKYNCTPSEYRRRVKSA